MDLFEYLPSEDVQQLWQYLDYYSGSNCAIEKDRMDYFLRYWNKAKEPFFHIFNKQFILKKEISFERPMNELADEMCNMLGYGDLKIKNFCKNYRKAIDAIFPYGYENDGYYLKTFVRDFDALAQNIYEGPTIIIDKEFTVDKHSLQVHSGCKMVKMLGKIAKALGVSDGYEEFRQAHSLILNQKKIRGNLCLSIHPLDFLTMSDNNCGWSSCMSWMEDFGDYRLGTIEMMNSPCVVIAYIESQNPFYVCNRLWSNKRWRQLYIVNKDIILGNRQYPYENDVVQGIAIKWLRDLCSKAPGWGPYEEEACEIYNNKTNILRGQLKTFFSIISDHMYNDVYDNRLAYISKSFNTTRYNLNFSGPAICTGCGEELGPDVDDNKVQCRSCLGEWQCSYCGGWYTDYDESYWVDGEQYCSYCYNELPTCDCCGAKSNELESIPIKVFNSEGEEITEVLYDDYHIELCPNCMDDESYKSLFGSIRKEILRSSCYNNIIKVKKAFDLTNITDEGLEHASCISALNKEYVKFIREHKNDENCSELIKKEWF